MKLFNIGKTSISVSITYLFLISYIFAFSLKDNFSLYGLVSGLLISIIISFSIFFHEMAHIKAAEYLGLSEKNDLTLWGLGGIATIPGLAKAKPIEEFIIALAGPLSSFVLSGIFFQFWLLTDKELIISLKEGGSLINFITCYGMLVNLGIAIFNLLPAFPMDGGRVLRSVIAMHATAKTATKIACIVAVFISIGMIIFGIWHVNIIMILVALFILICSLGELLTANKQLTNHSEKD